MRGGQLIDESPKQLLRIGAGNVAESYVEDGILEKIAFFLRGGSDHWSEGRSERLNEPGIFELVVCDEASFLKPVNLFRKAVQPFRSRSLNNWSDDDVEKFGGGRPQHWD